MLIENKYQTSTPKIYAILREILLHKPVPTKKKQYTVFYTAYFCYNVILLTEILAE